MEVRLKELEEKYERRQKQFEEEMAAKKEAEREEEKSGGGGGNEESLRKMEAELERLQKREEDLVRNVEERSVVSSYFSTFKFDTTSF